MPTLSIDVRAAMKGLARDLDRLRHDQVPFATARALTEVARKVAAAEAEELAKTFKKPTPFTLKAFTVRGARKQTLTATVFAKDIQAAYLEPYLDGGPHFLGSKRAILTPVQIALNAYGNIPKGKLQALKGSPGVFVGSVKLGAGKIVGGLWQRIEPPKAGRRRRGFVEPKSKLKLLIEFTDPKEVTQRLDYRPRAKAVVEKELPAAWDAAMRQALASAR